MMPLNKQRGNMYPWVTHTWNPVRGCKHDCVYCYVKSLAGYDMTPRLIKKELYYGLGKDRTIFVCSTADLFGEWVPEDWIKDVLAACNRYPHNRYLFQSKNPARFHGFISKFPPNVILGTTIESNRYMADNLSRAPFVAQRFLDMRSLRIRHETIARMISLEPLIDFDMGIIDDWIKEIKPSFISVGSDSKGHNLPEPPKEKIGALIHELSRFTDVKIKPNLRRLMR